MPGRATLKLASIVVPLIAAAILASGCASADHSWRGEFDARLEGASKAIEEEIGEFSPDSSDRQLADAGFVLGGPLEFKSELIRDLDPPKGCEEVQEEGRRKVGGLGAFSYDIFENLTPKLKRELPRPLEEAIAEYKVLEREAANCATG